METPRAKHKLREADFFLGRLRGEREADALAFGYFLSAFLNATYSFVEVLEVEAKRALSIGATTSRKQAKAAFRPWYESWLKDLPADEHQLWVLMEAQRRDEVHLLGAETVKETKAIPLEPMPRNPRTLYYMATMSLPPALLGNDAWRDERRRLGLPPWASTWREAQIHHFEIAGQRRDVVETCQRYLTLLERLLADFHRSSLVAAPGG